MRVQADPDTSLSQVQLVLALMVETGPVAGAGYVAERLPGSYVYSCNLLTNVAACTYSVHESALHRMYWGNHLADTAT
jgi:hypothetical protein